MILEELVLENFGPYAGRQVLDLSGSSSESPIVLVGGRNGEGKTTILEAILLALYGPHAPAMTGRSGAYERYLSSRIHHAAEVEATAAVGLTFRAVRGFDEEPIRIRRSWRSRGPRGAREEIEVWRSGVLDTALSDGWREFIETLVPRGVAPLFFFDGERIESLADLDAAAETLRTAVGALLGLELVDQLGHDLTALERRHASKVASPAAQDGLERTGAALDAAETKLARARQAVAAGKAKFERAEEHARRADERFRSEGGETYEARATREAELEAARTALDITLSRLREVAAGPLPLVLVSHELAALVAMAREERQAELASDLLRTLAQRDAETLAWVAKAGVSDQLRDELALRFKDDREHRARGAAVDPLARLSAAGLRHLESLVEETLPSQGDLALRLRDDAERAAEAKARAEVRLAEVPSADAIGDLIAERERVNAEFRQEDARLIELAQDLETAERERERAAEDHERALRRAAEEALGGEDSARILRHAERARATLGELRRRAGAQHMGRIEGLITESLKDLLRKDSLVDRVRIDPTTHELLLHARSGREVDTTELSAGERQLTALSLLWGLARASSKNLPVIIDTPLGRLDASHRSHLVSRYLPHASHQVLVLSTDTEVDRELASQLNGAVGASFRLRHDDKTQATEIVPGYFFEEAIAA